MRRIWSACTISIELFSQLLKKHFLGGEKTPLLKIAFSSKIAFSVIFLKTYHPEKMTDYSLKIDAIAVKSRQQQGIVGSYPISYPTAWYWKPRWLPVVVLSESLSSTRSLNWLESVFWRQLSGKKFYVNLKDGFVWIMRLVDRILPWSLLKKMEFVANEL